MRNLPLDVITPAYYYAPMKRKPFGVGSKKRGRGAPPVDIRSARIAAIQSEHGSLFAFLDSHGYPRATAWEALAGKFDGPKARAIVEHVKREFGL